MCEFRFCNQVFRVWCVYAPNSNPQRNQVLDDVSVRIDPSVPTVLAGDFNTVFDRFSTVVDRIPLMYLVNRLVL